ncbi:MAG: anthranilate phosphoribosyltransferase [Candidatus Marinimicrobia bacterium]|nr:anthranilate phosphoribosyltransferase [Candidatus Neomarinimicrobiota bacterium]
MIKQQIDKVIKRKNLTIEEAEDVMDKIMSGECTDAQIGGFLTALAAKGETVEEITACARVMREKATRIEVDRSKADRGVILDTCGTGGTGTDTFNISTTSALVIAAAGVKVAKHGNRAASSKCGSADVLEELGVNLEVTPDIVAESINAINIGFLYAPLLHKAMKYAIGPRRELGVRTVFNILGPLTNPASANAQVMGVFDADLTEPIGRVLANLGEKRAFVVHGEDNLDEITITGKTKISELKEGQVNTYYIKPEDFGLKRADLSEIKGGDASQNAKIVHSVLNGEKGAPRDIIVLNAAYGLLAADKVESPQAGVKLAQETIDSGKAKNKLQELIKQVAV